MAFCSNCGAKLEDGVAFCTNCGTKVGVVGAEQTPPQQNNSFAQTAQPHGATEYANTAPTDDDEALMRAYITGSTNPYDNGHHYDHYKKAFDKFAASDSKVNWNWGAFWTSGINIAYRKGYLWGIIIYLGCYLLSIFIQQYGIILTFLASLLPGMFADSFHYSRYKEKLAEAKRTCPNDKNAQISYMVQNGGVNKAVPIIWVIGIIIIGAVIGVMSTSNEYYYY